MKYLVSITLIITTFFSFAQLKELTLEDAVMQQYRSLRPKSLTMFQWVPDTDCYTYLNEYTTLMKASVRNTEAKELMNIQDLNAKLGSELYWFTGFEWKNENEFRVNDGHNYYIYNIVNIIVCTLFYILVLAFCFTEPFLLWQALYLQMNMTHNR